MSFSNDHISFVFNMLEERVAVLLNQTMAAGEHSIDWNAAGFASGIYMYRLSAGGYVESRKMVLVR